MKTTNEKQIRIRCVVPGLPAIGNGIAYYVVSESATAIHIDNRATNRFYQCAVTLAKLPNGNLANSAGQEFEIVPQEAK